MLILYPVAAGPDAALNGPLGWAAREREAGELAGGEVSFVTEAAGPAFATLEAARAAYAGKAEDADWWTLAEVARPGGRHDLAPVKPAFAEGRRWPAARQPVATVWRLQLSYWRVAAAEVEPADQARAARRMAEGPALEPMQLRAFTRQRLQAVRPQQPLDIGLFERRLPEAPHMTIPDE